MITATGSHSGPVIEVLKWIPKILDKNRAPEVLLGRKYIEECVQSVIVCYLYVSRPGVVTKIVDHEAILRGTALDVYLGRKIGLIRVATCKVKTNADLG